MRTKLTTIGYWSATTLVAIAFVLGGAIDAAHPPDSYLRGLGVTPLSGVTLSALDAFGRTESDRVAFAPAVTLGSLTVRDVLVAVSTDHAILGESVLAHAPWELDFDRSTITLGAEPWEEDANLVPIPLQHLGDGNADLLTLTVDDQPIEMLLDTGAIHG
jgi:hypothetical protein